MLVLNYIIFLPFTQHIISPIKYYYNFETIFEQISDKNKTKISINRVIEHIFRFRFKLGT